MVKETAGQEELRLTTIICFEQYTYYTRTAILSTTIYFDYCTRTVVGRK